MKSRLYSNITVHSVAVVTSQLYYSAMTTGILLILGEYMREMGWR
jgi:hypothetical protein